MRSKLAKLAAASSLPLPPDTPASAARELAFWQRAEKAGVVPPDPAAKVKVKAKRARGG